MKILFLIAFCLLAAIASAGNVVVGNGNCVNGNNNVINQGDGNQIQGDQNEITEGFRNSILGNLNSLFRTNNLRVNGDGYNYENTPVPTTNNSQ
jgi:hypothetical protein